MQLIGVAIGAVLGSGLLALGAGAMALVMAVLGTLLIREVLALERPVAACYPGLRQRLEAATRRPRGPDMPSLADLVALHRTLVRQPAARPPEQTAVANTNQTAGPAATPAAGVQLAN